MRKNARLYFFLVIPVKPTIKAHLQQNSLSLRVYLRKGLSDARHVVGGHRVRMVTTKQLDQHRQTSQRQLVQLPDKRS